MTLCAQLMELFARHLDITRQMTQRVGAGVDGVAGNPRSTPPTTAIIVSRRILLIWQQEISGRTANFDGDDI